ncbi:hypothetical protein SRHO_G00198180 [Serrasalmus rhombeus]
MKCDTIKLWADIEDVVLKALISAQYLLCHNYHFCFPWHAVNPAGACFELLAFDVMLDHRVKPWLLEVNHSPSFTTDSWLDREVKDELLYDTLVLVNLGACDRQKASEEERCHIQKRLQQASKKGLTLHMPRGPATIKEQQGLDAEEEEMETQHGLQYRAGLLRNVDIVEQVCQLLNGTPSSRKGPALNVKEDQK